jgi:hypothetical protein
MALGIAASLARPGGNVTGFWLEGDEAHLKGNIAAVAPAQFVQPPHKGSEPVARDRRSRWETHGGRTY